MTKKTEINVDELSGVSGGVNYEDPKYSNIYLALDKLYAIFKREYENGNKYDYCAATSVSVKELRMRNILYPIVQEFAKEVYAELNDQYKLRIHSGDVINETYI